MTRRTALLGATLAALTLAASFPSAAVAPEKSASAARLEVTYYYLPT